MTASQGKDPALFDWFLKNVGDPTSNFARGVVSGYNTQAGGATPLSTLPDPMSRLGKAGAQSGQFLYGSRSALPLTSAGLAGVGSFLQGGNAGEVTGSTLGGLGGGALANTLNTAIMKAPLPAIAKVPLAALNMIGTPLVASALGGKVGDAAQGAIGNAVNTFSGVANPAANERLDQALNPANPRNTVDASIEKQLDTFNKLRETLGDERAAAIAFQKQALTNAADVNNIDMLNRVGAAALATTFTSPARMMDQQNQGAIENTKSILNEAGALARQYAAAGNPYTVNYA